MSVSRLIRFWGVLPVFLLVALIAPADAYAQGEKLGDVMTRVTDAFSSFPNILSAFAYVMGIYLAVLGIFKFKDHVDNPVHNPLSAGVKRFLAGGAFLAIPASAKAVRETLTESGNHGLSITGRGQATSGDGMDQMIVDFISNIYEPMSKLLVGFVYVSAIILLFVGIMRLTKTAQEGPRGPTGLGTIMTFLVSGCLFAAGDMMGAFASSLFGDATIMTGSAISTDVISGPEKERIEAVVDALMAFIMLVGFIAFIRGFFVLKAFADGTQGATIAQALTFLFGGALAINLGELVNVLQNTVGVSGITFN